MLEKNLVSTFLKKVGDQLEISAGIKYPDGQCWSGGVLQMGRRFLHGWLVIEWGPLLQARFYRRHILFGGVLFNR